MDQLKVMKRSTILLVLSLFLPFSGIIAQSREFKPFKVDFGITTVFPTEGISGNGNGFYFSPIFNLTDKFSTGPRLQFAYATHENKNYISSYLNNEITDLFSLLSVSDFYLSKDRARFFIGFGFGLYSQIQTWKTISLRSIDFYHESLLSLGIMPRFGFNVGHFKMAAQYNITGPSMYNYLDFTLGLEIGGGKYK
jgi:hypothetical protein